MTEGVPGTNRSYYPTMNHCVNNNIGKITFGNGTQVYVQPSEYNCLSNNSISFS